MDPPYGDHIDYSDDPSCIGKLSAFDPKYYQAMHRAISEAARILKPGGTFGLYVCDYFEKKVGFAPVGFQLFMSVAETLTVVDIVTRRSPQQVARARQLPEGGGGGELLPPRLQLPLHRPEAR